MSKSRYISVEKLRVALDGLLGACGVPNLHRAYVLETLILTSLWGVDTHGVELLPTYLRELENGRSVANPRLTWTSDRSGVAVLDAGGALGIIGGNVGVRKAIDIARINGIAAVAVKNSNHFGAAGYYAQFAADVGMVCFAFSNSDALVAPFQGRRALNGTNPIAIAAVGERGDVFHLDMATSQVAYSRVRKYLANDLPIPFGWAIDEYGIDTHDSSSFFALKPLGGYKGQGLGMAVQLLCCLFTGMPLDYEISNLFSEPYTMQRRIGHFFICIDIAGLVAPVEFKKRLSELLQMFRTSEGVHNNSVFVPGDLERISKKNRTIEGIPISDNLYNVLGFND